MGVGRSEVMYVVKLKWIGDMDPSFYFETLEEAIEQVEFFLSQGYKVVIEKYSEEEEAE